MLNVCDRRGKKIVQRKTATAVNEGSVLSSDDTTAGKTSVVVFATC